MVDAILVALRRVKVQNATSAMRCFGKPAPVTFDAIGIGTHYIDPRILSAWIKSALAASAIVFCFVFSLLY